MEPDQGSRKHDIGESRSRPIGETKSMAGKTHESANKVVTGQAKPGKGMAGIRIMPKKDMAELDKGRTGLHVAVQRLVMKLSLQNNVRISL